MGALFEVVSPTRNLPSHPSLACLTGAAEIKYEQSPAENYRRL